MKNSETQDVASRTNGRSQGRALTKRKNTKTRQSVSDYPILRLLPRPQAPAPQCQEVADVLALLKNEALHGMHVGALILLIHPGGGGTWHTRGTLGKNDNITVNAAADLSAAVFNECWKGL